MLVVVLIVSCSFFFFYHSQKKNNPEYKLEKIAKSKQKRPFITIMGPLKMADGIGRQTAELASIFVDDYKINIISKLVDLTDIPNKIKPVINKHKSRLGKVVIVEETLWVPGVDISRLFNKTDDQDQIRIAYTMLESTRIPQEWVFQINTYFDAIVVPDPFLVEAYKKSGVMVPIFAIPLGLDLQDFLSKPIKQKRNSPMVFANFSACLDRKNQLTLIRAFAKELGNNENAILRINCRNYEPKARDAIIKEIKNLNCNNIYFSELELNRDVYVKVFQTVDCYVSLSKAEGFSIQPREAMALGIPVIATDNTGQSTICSSNLVRRVKSEILEPAIYTQFKLPYGNRFNCTIDDAAEAIRDVYLNYDKYLEKKEEARDWARQYCYSNEKIKNIYHTLVNPKKIILGATNKVEEGALYTDSPELYKKYLELNTGLEKQAKKKEEKSNYYSFFSKIPLFKKHLK